MATTLEQILALAEQLSPDKQKAALRYIQQLAESEGILEPELPSGTPGSFYLKFSFHPEDAERIEQAITQEPVYQETVVSTLPPGSPGSALLRFSLPEEDVDAMERVIVENFEKL